jgi:aromatic ring-opening dioxygenase catalytic subunit (LigB family)
MLSSEGRQRRIYKKNHQKQLRKKKVFATLNSLDYGTWGVLMPKGNATAHPKMGTLKQTVWQWQAAKVGRCCAKIAGRSEKVVAVGGGNSD